MAVYNCTLDLYDIVQTQLAHPTWSDLGVGFYALLATFNAKPTFLVPRKRDCKTQAVPAVVDPNRSSLQGA